MYTTGVQRLIGIDMQTFITLIFFTLNIKYLINNNINFISMTILHGLNRFD